MFLLIFFKVVLTSWVRFSHPWSLVHVDNYSPLSIYITFDLFGLDWQTSNPSIMLQNGIFRVDHGSQTQIFLSLTQLTPFCSNQMSQLCVELTHFDYFQHTASFLHNYCKQSSLFLPLKVHIRHHYLFAFMIKSWYANRLS